VVAGNRSRRECLMWQDYVLTAGSLAFIVALLPAVWSEAKPPRSTCALTGAVLWAYAIVDATLSLNWTALTTAGTAALWTVLLLQKRLDTGLPA